MPTLQDVARICNVSSVTVSRALRNDRVHTSKETIERIRAVARQIGYDPARHQAARRLALSRTGESAINRMIAFYFPGDYDTNVYFYTIFKGIMEVATRERFAVLSVAEKTHDGQAPLAFRRSDVDGVISLWGARDFGKLLDVLRAEVGFGDRPATSLIIPVEGASSVVADDYDGGYKIAEHLLSLGHRYMLHFCTDVEVPPHMERLRGYKDAFRSYGLDPDAHLYVMEWSDVEGNKYDNQLLSFLRDNPQVTAIMARNDLIASTIYRTLTSRGIRVPDDISLTGFDDVIPVFDNYGNNILTTIRLHLLELGRVAAEHTIRQVLEKKTDQLKIVIPAQLVVRGSTAAPKEVEAPA